MLNPTTVPMEQKESARWLETVTRSARELGDPGRCAYAGDREAGIFELLHAAHDARTHFLVRTAVDRLTNLSAVLCVVGWRVFWLTMVNRTAPETLPEAVLTAAEIGALDRMAAGARP